MSTFASIEDKYGDTIEVQTEEYSNIPSRVYVTICYEGHDYDVSLLPQQALVLAEGIREAALSLS